ncbi:MAG: radical SAM protein [Thermodesulfobacteriota bacterium]
MAKNFVTLGRGLRIAWRHPNLIHTLLRMEYRHRWGIERDRRLRPGYSAPPTNLAICLTYRCNLRCAMCRQWRRDQDEPDNRPWYDRHRELPLATWVSLLDQVAPFRPWVYVTGGEPMISPNFKGLIQAARQRGLVVQVQTNGTLLAGAAEFLAQAGVLAVSISLDGPPEVHDGIRGVKGTFRRLAEGVEALQAARAKFNSPTPVLGFNCTISKGNLNFLPDTVRLAVEMKADALQLQHTMFNSTENVVRHNAIFNPEWVHKMDLDMALPSIREGGYYQSEIGPEDIPKLKAGLNEARALAKGRLKLLYMPKIPDELLGSYYLDLQYPFTPDCDAFWKTLRVAPDGAISSCLNLKGGNIVSESFTEIWNGPKMQAIRRLFSKSLFPGCARCCQRHYLKGSRAF